MLNAETRVSGEIRVRIKDLGLVLTLLASTATVILGLLVSSVKDVAIAIREGNALAEMQCVEVLDDSE